METLRKLREIDTDVKPVVSSGYSNDPVMSKFKDFGFCNCVFKPYRLVELKAVLNDRSNSAVEIRQDF